MVILYARKNFVCENNNNMYVILKAYIYMLSSAPEVSCVTNDKSIDVPALFDPRAASSFTDNSRKLLSSLAATTPL